MGDRAYAELTLLGMNHDTESVNHALDHLSMWFDTVDDIHAAHAATTTAERRRILLAAEWVDDEVSVAITYELPCELADAGCIFRLSQSGVYEYEAETHINVPTMGSAAIIGNDSGWSDLVSVVRRVRRGLSTGSTSQTLWGLKTHIEGEMLDAVLAEGRRYHRRDVIDRFEELEQQRSVARRNEEMSVL